MDDDTRPASDADQEVPKVDTGIPPTSRIDAALAEVAESEKEPSTDAVSIGATPEEQRTESTIPSKTPEQKKRGNKFTRWYASHKKISIPLTILLALLIAATAVYFTDARYAVMNLFGHASVTVDVRDAKTHQLVPRAIVTIASKSATTDDKGHVVVNDVPYGHATLTVTKNAYADYSSNVLVDHSGLSESYELTPTGTPLSFEIKNSLNGKTVSGVKLTYKTSDALSASDGKATLLVPPQDSDDVTVQLAADGYVASSTKVSLKAASSKATTLTITPAGSIYFLSKRTGTINVMKSNLDGTGQSVVLAGTGKEDDRGTVLLASRDWKYLALLARRDDDTASLYLITAATGAVTTIDDSNASFDMVGWDGHNFVYKANYNTVEYWQAKAREIKSFNAETNKTMTLDTSQTDGTDSSSAQYQLFTTPYIDKDGIVYASYWVSGYQNPTGDHEQQLIAIRSDGSGKQVLGKYPASTVSSIDAKLYEPNGVYFLLSGPNKVVEAEDGAITDTTVTQNDFYGATYDTYLLSPSGKSTLWSDPRDGKQTLFVGDADGLNGKELYSSDKYVAYGWYADDYLLLSVDGSELYAVGKDGGVPVKISDYHKPSVNFSGYGAGYGGF